MAFKASVILRDKVRKAYSAAAERPHETHAFPVGRAFAESLGYPQELLASLPNISVVSIGMARNFTMAVWCRSPAKSANRRCGYPDTLFGDCCRVTGKQEGILQLAPMVQFP